MDWQKGKFLLRRKGENKIPKRKERKRIAQRTRKETKGKSLVGIMKEEGFFRSFDVRRTLSFIRDKCQPKSKQTMASRSCYAAGAAIENVQKISLYKQAQAVKSAQTVS